MLIARFLPALVSRPLLRPEHGQFLNVDPLVDETGEAYAYTGDDPVNETDPLGLAASCPLTTPYALLLSSNAPPVPGGIPSRADCVAIVTYLNNLLGSGHNPARVRFWQQEYQTYRLALNKCRAIYGIVPNRPRKRNNAVIPVFKQPWSNTSPENVVPVVVPVVVVI